MSNLKADFDLRENSSNKIFEQKKRTLGKCEGHQHIRRENEN
jgi:hypothetical protein